jgi:general secretion pathway protein B
MPQEPVAAAEVQPAPVPATIAAPVGEPADDTMRLSDLGAEERQQLPTLKLSMHMWNDTPAQRFVILDGQRLGEGDRIGAAVVEQITRDGAILAWNGRRLRVSMR